MRRARLRFRLDNGAGRVPCQKSRLEEDLAMRDRASTTDSADNNLSEKADQLDDAREAALMREIIRAQERHREGGVEPELDDVDRDPEADAWASPP